MLTAAVLSTIVATVAPASAAPGDLDPGFAGGGLAVDHASPGRYEAVAIQGDRKIVVAGMGWRNERMDVQIVRYLSSGARDPSFGDGGRTLSDFGQDEQATAVAIQADGKIVIGGTRSYDWTNPGVGAGMVARYNVDGSLDVTFGTGGWVNLGAPTGKFSPNAVALQGDGDVLVGGVTELGEGALLMRLHRDGSIDRTFTNLRPMDDPMIFLPVAMRHIAGIGTLPGGGILLAGPSALRDKEGGGVAVRLLPTGALDPTFATAGVARARMGEGGAALGMALQRDGKVVLVGESTPTLQHREFVVSRLTTDGRPDVAFGLAGEMHAAVGDAQNSSAISVAVAPDGSLFVGGSASAGPGGAMYVPNRQFLAHVGRSGLLDRRFGEGGIATTTVGGDEQFGAVALQADGAPVAVGSSRLQDDRYPRGFILRTLPARKGGPMVGWGWNGFRQVGAVVGVLLQPTAGLGARTDVAVVSAGAYHSLSLDMDGQVWAAGWNAFGQLGDGTTIDRGTPVPVAGLSGVVAISAGAYHGLAVKGDGTVWAWGWNGFGQLGDGTTEERHVPVRVGGLDDVVGATVAAGAFHSLLVATDGSVRAWGFNGLGELGDGTTVERHLPVAVAGLSGATAVAAGAYHSVALRADGSLLSWGWNVFGQLGDGTTVQRDHPVPVSGIAGVVALGNGSWFHTVVVRGDGSAWAWGWNGYGQLGDGTTVERHTPVRVAGVTGLVEVAGGALHTVGVDAAGMVRGWGGNNAGQLGTGTLTDAHLAVPVRLPVGAVVSVSAGAYHSVAG